MGRSIQALAYRIERLVFSSKSFCCSFLAIGSKRPCRLRRSLTVPNRNSTRSGMSRQTPFGFTSSALWSARGRRVTPDAAWVATRDATPGSAPRNS